MRNHLYYGLVVFGFSLIVSTGMGGEQPGVPVEVPMGYAAEVGGGKVTMEDAFEVWAPMWYDTLRKVERGIISPEKGDEILNEEWRKALLALVKDELFYQEAALEDDLLLRNIVEMIYRNGDGSRSKQSLRSELEERRRRDRERIFQEMTHEFVKGSGGMMKLRQVLRGRGVTFSQWQNRLKKKAITSSYLQLRLKPRAPNPGPKALQDYYASHPDEFTTKGAVRFRHIFFSTERRGGDDQAREAATKVWQAIEAGEIPFPDAAAKYSDDPPSRERGGLEDEPEAADPEREAWLSELRKSAREEKLGELGPILDSPFGYHLIWPLSVEPDKKVPFREASKSIERRLENEVFQAEVDKFFATLRKNTPIRVLVPNFPSELSCSVQARNPIPRPAGPPMRGNQPLPGL